MAYVRHYDVLLNDKYGRYIVANKELNSGEIIFTDVPFAVGPKPGKLRVPKAFPEFIFKTIGETTIDGCFQVLFYIFVL